MNTEQIAAILRKAKETGTACPPVRSFMKEKDLQTAYEVQKINIDLRLQKGKKQVGKKIGLTSEKVQLQLGVNQPDFGILLDEMQIKNGEDIPFSELMQPKAEAEIAFILKEDLTGSDIDITKVKQAVDYAVAAIEIVGSRIENWDIHITDTIADNASSSHFVLSENRVQIDDFDLINCGMKLLKNDKIASEGSGKACLGNPLKAVLWLAEKMNELGNPLQKGDVILSGALGPMVNITKGDYLKAEIQGLGEVSFSVS